MSKGNTHFDYERWDRDTRLPPSQRSRDMFADDFEAKAKVLANTRAKEKRAERAARIAETQKRRPVKKAKPFVILGSRINRPVHGW